MATSLKDAANEVFTMTLAKAKEELRVLGMTITKRGDEYRVNFAGGNDATAYYSNDITDAVCTGIMMHKHTEVVRG